jgi:hypothetical protein
LGISQRLFGQLLNYISLADELKYYQAMISEIDFSAHSPSGNSA